MNSLVETGFVSLNLNIAQGHITAHTYIIFVSVCQLFVIKYNSRTCRGYKIHKSAFGMI